MRQWDFQERRKLPRYEISLSSDETDLNSRQQIHSVTRDICEQGVGVVLSERLPMNSPMDICLEMPDNQELIHLHGKVVWVAMVDQNQFRAGIQLDKFELRPIPLVLRMIKVSLKSRYYQ